MNELTTQKLLRLQNEVDQLLQQLESIKAQRNSAKLTLVASEQAHADYPTSVELSGSSPEISAA